MGRESASEWRGVRGSGPGLIIRAMASAKALNPVLLLDGTPLVVRLPFASFFLFLVSFFFSFFLESIDLSVCLSAAFPFCVSLAGICDLEEETSATSVLMEVACCSLLSPL